MPSKADIAAKHEKLARGMAMGLSASAAGVAAGYKRGGSGACKAAAHAPLQARVAELEKLFLWTGSFEPAPLIMELLATARKSAGLGSGAGMNAAAHMYAEIGRLTAKLASRPAGQDDDLMTDDEWAAKYGAPT